ncbi:MAG: peptide-methionine (S)-S-oxide reductase MsrA [Actinobacteria bacterium]|nr:peptide-methionine (S)-S-oxide reductase MsrA [Actinomycetota bacterium]MBU1943484.1 peptide-methionine (S)-S-oxide reductase MsrA [Actinomycetota bacterium]MBU2686841.1 peptide-methionine (S)-S-oxide reductase MsrA [Actinomycetota bacterium]
MVAVIAVLPGCGGAGSGKVEAGLGAVKQPARRAASTTAEGAGSSTPASGTERVVLGGGCFWCIEASLDLMDGVVETTSGYAGGTTIAPGYEEVCAGDTGHAEVVSVVYDPAKTSLEKVLDVFFASHDPTSLNKQGNDAGTQYRSVILYDSVGQKARVEAYIESIRGDYDGPIVTQVVGLGEFYSAEDYHQDYYENNPDQPYSRYVIEPKVEKIRKLLGLP